MKSKNIGAGLIPAIALVLTAGCVEPRVVQVPVYQTPPGSQGQVAYPYPAQGTYQSVPQPTPPPAVQQVPAVSAPTTPAPPPNEAAVAPQAAPAQPATPPPPVVVQQAPPAPHVEVVTVAPGPGYYWAPGYWAWNGTWVWVSGRWVVRPHPHAVWVGGHWARSGGGWIWVGGHWR